MGEQNLTNTNPPTVMDAEPVKQMALNEAQRLYIDFTAVQGLLVDEDGNIERMTATEFARKIGYSRTTLFNWQKQIPQFWDLVKTRRAELGGNNRITKVYNGLFLKGSAGDAPAAALWLANHDPDFRMPNQKMEQTGGRGLADLLQIARKAENERKVIDGTTNDNPQ
jgi:hypothetical protein